MTGEQDAFFRTICEYPFDLRPRLVYADWLDENDDGRNGYSGRAEFIRVQIELDDKPHCSGSANRQVSPNCGDPECQACLLRCRESHLLAVNWHEWSGRRFTFCQNFLPDDQGSVGVKFAGGFPTSVRCPLAWWVGGECPTCFGCGTVDALDPDDFAGTRACPDCDYKRTTPGHGADVVSRHPVTKVVVTDREPHPNVAESWSWWDEDWWRDSDTHQESNLPGEVFARLTGGILLDGTGRLYPAREDAVEALSRVLVGWAREQAGLTPIPWEVSQ